MSLLSTWLQQPVFDSAPEGFKKKVWLGVLLLLAVGIKVTWGLSQYMDMLLWDEANYMKAGSHFLKHINKEWGPAYAAWYQGGFVFVRDLLQLYILNQAVLTLLVPVLFYLLLVRTGVYARVALLISAGWLCAAFHLPMWPKVSHFCVAMVLGGLLMASRQRQPFMQWLWIAFGSMLAAFARPELYITFLALLGITAGSFLVTRPPFSKSSIVAIAGILVVGVFFHLKIGIPLLNGGRSGMAFAQHFTYNIVLQQNLPFDFWIVWPDICREYLGQATSFSGAWKANQPAVADHLSVNFRSYLTLLADRPAEAVFPSLLWRTSPVLQQLLFIGLLIYGYLVLRRQAATPLPGSSYKIGLVLLLLAAPAAMASILIFPREHYFMLQLPFILYLAALPFTGISYSGKKAGLVLLLLIFLLPVLAPSAKKFTYFHLWHHTEGTPNNLAFRKLNQLKGTERLVIMDNEGGMAKLIKGAVWVRGFEKELERGFYDFLAVTNPDIIYVTPALQRDKRYMLDGQWMIFSMNPQSFGYKKVPLPPSNNFYLLVRDEAPYNTLLE
jgi:hypothetical protein